MAMDTVRIAFIGGGNMGEAMLSAILDRGLSTPQTISVSEVSKARRQHLEHKYGVAVMSDNRQAVTRGDVAVLAIKPQNLAEVMAELRGRLNSTQLVLSIIAGARINTLCLGLDHGCVVRAMPNTPAQIGEGITVWTATPEGCRSEYWSAPGYSPGVGVTDIAGLRSLYPEVGQAAGRVAEDGYLPRWHHG